MCVKQLSMSVSRQVCRNSGCVQEMDTLKDWGCQRYPDIAIQRIHRSTFCAATSVNHSVLFSTLVIKRFARLSRALSDHDRRSCWTSLQLPETHTQAKSLNNERSPFSAHFQLGKLSEWWGKSPSQPEEWPQVTNVQPAATAWQRSCRQREDLAGCSQWESREAGISWGG